MTSIAAGPDILLDPLFTVSGAGGAVDRHSLATLLARMIAGPEVLGFPRVAAEQRSHVWRFMVRCAGKALHQRGWAVDHAARMPFSELEVALRDTLRTASGDPSGERGIWRLYQPDATQPGFLQAPTPNGRPPAEAKYVLNTASILTSAIGSKGHERKVDAARSLDAEQLVYALLELQSGAIFGGRGNYGSQIMGSASGAGSGTPFMGARLGTGECETFRHDVDVLLAGWEDIHREHGLRGSIWALWTEPWDGESSLPVQRLDPAFIPLARLIRLGPPNADGLFDAVWFRATNKARVHDPVGGGNLGDPFTPLIPDLKSAALKVRGTLEGGYGYGEIVNLLFGGDPKRRASPSPSVRALHSALHDGRTDVRVLFEGTAYEQGKTVGFYRREVLLPPSTEVLMDDPDRVRAIHGEMIARVREVKSALNGAARMLLAGKPKSRDGDAGKISAPAGQFDAKVDQHYLTALLEAAAGKLGDTAWRAEWMERLVAWAEASFRQTMDSIPTATARRYEREVRALHWLDQRLRRISLGAGGTDASPETDTPELLA